MKRSSRINIFSAVLESNAGTIFVAKASDNACSEISTSDMKNLNKNQSTRQTIRTLNDRNMNVTRFQYVHHPYLYNNKYI